MVVCLRSNESQSGSWLPLSFETGVVRYYHDENNVRTPGICVHRLRWLRISRQTSRHAIHVPHGYLEIPRTTGLFYVEINVWCMPVSFQPAFPFEQAPIEAFRIARKEQLMYC